MLNTIKHLNLIPINLYQLDDIVLKYGVLSNDEIKISRRYFEVKYDLPFFTKEIDTINDKDYAITEVGDGYIVSKNKPLMVEIEISETKNPIYIEDKDIFSTLNYKIFESQFNNEAFNCFYYTKLYDDCVREFISDLKLHLYNTTSNISAKIMFKELLTHITISKSFLNRFDNDRLLETRIFKRNVIQFSLSEHLKKYIEIIESEIRAFFNSIFPEEINGLEEIEKTVKDKLDRKYDKLRSSNIYNIASLFANGTIIFDGFSAIYNNKSYENISTLSKEVSKKLGINVNSIQPYLNQTIKEVNSEKNIFSYGKLKYLDLIISDFESQNKNVAQFFIDKWNYLLSNIPE